MSFDRRCQSSAARLSRVGHPFGRAVRIVLVVSALGLGAPAGAQTLAEVTLVAALSSQLHPIMSLPSGSYRAEGPGAAMLIARLPDPGSWTDWEVYTARGLVLALEQALVYGVQRDLMVAGYYEVSREETAQADGRHVRMIFEGDGGRALLHVIRESDALVWLLARGR